LEASVISALRSVSVSPSIADKDPEKSDTARPIDTGPPQSGDLWARSTLFDGVTTDQLIELRSFCRECKFVPGEVIVREGSLDPHFYILIEGVAHVTKTTSIGDVQMRIAELRSGDVLGELKIVDPQPASASVVAVTQVTTLAMDLDIFAGSAELANVRAVMLGNIGRILAARLRATTSGSADAMQREIDETRARAHAGRFIVLMFTMLAVYQLAISALVLVPGTARPRTSVISFIFVIWSAIPVVLALWRTPFSLKSYGLTIRHGGRIAVQALFWTAPLLLLVLALKFAWLRWTPSMADQQLIDPTAVFSGRPFNLGIYLIAIFLYMLHAPLQELVARAGFQGTLQNFIPTRPGSINWKAILISNLLFASAHSFIGFWFCVAAFVPGLFWGWMFAKQRSLVGVSISHIAIGVWAIFAVGVQAIIGGD
jgi:CRP-like cAMP-binding protein/membrane protease YdiL (CAAX protease family)